MIVWLTGLSGAGKTTLGRLVYAELLARTPRVEFLDADTLRGGINRDLGFSRQDREENVRRIGYIAALLSRHHVIAIVAAIAPYRSLREEIRKITEHFIEVHVDAPLEVCEKRDPKGLYRKARAGEISLFTGIDDPYEAPLMPEVVCQTNKESAFQSAARIVTCIRSVLDKEAKRYSIKGESRDSIESEVSVAWPSP
jgi:adenylyl-sulfate kinase